MGKSMNMAMTRTSAPFYGTNHKFGHSKNCVECGFDSVSTSYLLWRKKNHVKPHHFDILHTSHVTSTPLFGFFV